MTVEGAGDGSEFWFAQELMKPLGYAHRENFQTAINQALDPCETTGYAAREHFRDLTKMVKLGSVAKHPVDDFMLTHYACNLIAQNGEI